MTIASAPSDIHRTRRENLLILLREYTEQQLMQGLPAKGIEQLFAAHVGLSTSRLSQFKSSRNIADKVARQLEAHAQKESGWLDSTHKAPVVTAAEDAFVELARAAWRGTDAKGRRQLLRLAKGGFTE